jgi:large subunit ribosomal protein L20
MTRAVSNVPRHQRKRRMMKAAKGYYGGRRRLYRSMKETLIQAGRDSYRGRKGKKREYRSLWIIRISAAAKSSGMTYHRFINGLTKAKVAINRKIISELAIHQPEAFEKLVQIAKANV